MSPRRRRSHKRPHRIRYRPCPGCGRRVDLEDAETYFVMIEPTPGSIRFEPGCSSRCAEKRAERFGVTAETLDALELRWLLQEHPELQKVFVLASLTEALG